MNGAPGDVRAFAEGCWRGRSVPRVLPFVREEVLPDPERRARAGRVLRESRYRVTAQVTDRAGAPVLLKAHHRAKGREGFARWRRTSRAEAEFEALRWLRVRGLPAPAPLAVGARRRHGALEAAFLVTEWLADRVPLRTALAEARPSDRRTLTRSAGRLVRSLHDAGFDHRDLHGENLLVERQGGGLTLVDVHRHARGRAPSDRARARALGRLLHDLGGVLGPGGRRRLLAAYAGPDGAETVRRLARATTAVAARLERVRRRSRARRCLVESTVYTRDVGAHRGARRRDLPLERLERALVEHADALAHGDARVVKVGRKSRLTRHGDLVVKETFAAPGGRWKDLLAPRRRRAGYRNAHLLDVLGVATARPLAWVRAGGRDLTLYEDLSGLPRLDHHARAVYRQGSRGAQVRLREATADWLAGLHRRGIYHGDLKGVNVLVRDGAGGLAFPLIDTDRVRVLDGGVDRRRRVKNLAQLAASIPQVVSRTERLRWLRRYAAGTALAEREREVWRAVGAQVARKIVVVDEPIE